MVLTEAKTYTFWYGGNFLVDVVEISDQYEMYVYNSNCGVKLLVMSSLQINHSTINDFVEEILDGGLIELAIQQYICDFMTK